MVEYDKNADALTLGDDDSLKVGDYELKYSSANDRFEVEHPNGEVSDVPRSTSGSLVPEGFADVLSNGEVLADNGEIYTSVQTAVDNSTGFVFVGPGTFTESVSIDKEGLSLVGVGFSSFIDGRGGSTGAIVINSDNVTVRSIRGETNTDASGDIALHGIGTNSAFINCSVTGSELHGIQVNEGGRILNCTTQNTGVIENDTFGAIRTPASATNVIISGCHILSPSSNGISLDSDGDVIVSNCFIRDAGKNGIRFRGPPSDSIIIGSRIRNSSNRGIRVRGTDNIIANNRVSDSGDIDISDDGTGTVLDGNLTGPSN